MASIYKRKDKEGKSSGWRAVIRLKGYPTVCEHFDRKQEAEDWAIDVEKQIKQGKFNFSRHKHQHTFAELVEHFINNGALEHHRSAKDSLRHLNYWKDRLGAYSLVHLTPERLGKERQQLIETPTKRGEKRSPATVNRYIATLSSALTYACRQLRWLDDNPCFNLIKLKEAPGRDRVLTSAEVQKLLDACHQSRNTYLYCIVLLAFTTGMRQGEILNLTWEQINFELDPTLPDETVKDYIIRMATAVEAHGKGERLEWRALKSFLAYLRNLANEEWAFIEQIFPQEMDVQHSRIIRKIDPEVYSIPQEAAGDILVAIADVALNGRSNNQLSALESLGLCWLCLTTSRLRLPTQLEFIVRTPPSVIGTQENAPILEVPTLFGQRKVRISHRMHNYLLALSRIPSKKPRETILQCPIRTLRRTLDRVIIKLNLNLGNITYITFLSPPHLFGKNKRPGH